MPPGADPMDVRYNIVQWVHRSTRGWSYGASVIDPRTGEIHPGPRHTRVTAGTAGFPHRARAAPALRKRHGTRPRLLQTALARLRQLAAHEVGHTLGLQHNFASIADGRTSVMDYPPPYITLGGDGNLDFSQAYAMGIGEWDKRTVLYGYQDFANPAEEKTGLAAILKDNRRRVSIHHRRGTRDRPAGRTRWHICGTAGRRRWTS